MFAWHAYHEGNATPYVPRDHEHLFELLRRVWPEARSVLDFGCGHGHFIRVARSAGWDARGIELDVVTRERATAFSGCTVTDLENAIEADVVSTRDSLFAVPHPTDVVKRLRPARLLVDMAVEENPRLALLARIPAWCRRSTREGTPTILWRASAAGIDRWLASLGYDRVYRKISDAGWPYIYGKSRFRRAVGHASIATSKLVPFFGDRMIALYVKQPAGSREPSL